MRHKTAYIYSNTETLTAILASRLVKDGYDFEYVYETDDSLMERLVITFEGVGRASLEPFLDQIELYVSSEAMAGRTDYYVTFHTNNGFIKEFGQWWR